MNNQKDMPFIFFGNRDVGLNVFKHLVKINDIPAIVVLDKKGSSIECDTLWRISKKHNCKQFCGDELNSESFMIALRETSPSLGISAYFGYIIDKTIIDKFNFGIVNIHGSLLPWNKGKDPNMWAIVDGKKAGVTLHLMDQGIDTGEIISQRKIPVKYEMTAGDLYKTIASAALELFTEWWPSLRRGEFCANTQKSIGSFHLSSDREKYRNIYSDQAFTAHEFINMLKATTENDRGGMLLHHENEVYEVKISIKKMER
ncbi:MAG: formyltransferase family protein [bacterium]